MFSNFTTFSLHEKLSHGHDGFVPKDGSECAIILNSGVVVADVTWNEADRQFKAWSESYDADDVSKFYQYYT